MDPLYINIYTYTPDTDSNSKMVPLYINIHIYTYTPDTDSHRKMVPLYINIYILTQNIQPAS